MKEKKEVKKLLMHKKTPEDGEDNRTFQILHFLQTVTFTPIDLLLIWIITRTKKTADKKNKVTQNYIMCVLFNNISLSLAWVFDVDITTCVTQIRDYNTVLKLMIFKFMVAVDMEYIFVYFLVD